MVLCQTCQSIDIRGLFESWNGSSASDRGVSYSSWLDYHGATEHYQPHHDSFAALRAAANSGSDFCCMAVVHHRDMPL
jgi:hypothetical protein